MTAKNAVPQQKIQSTFRSPLTVAEYRALIDYKYRRATTQGGPGWALVTAEGVVDGYHWWDIDGWNTRAAALSSFVPEPNQRHYLTDQGWEVHADNDGHLLAWYLRALRGENPPRARIPGWTQTEIHVDRDGAVNVHTTTH